VEREERCVLLARGRIGGGKCTGLSGKEKVERGRIGKLTPHCVVFYDRKRAKLGGNPCSKNQKWSENRVYRVLLFSQNIQNRS